MQKKNEMSPELRRKLDKIADGYNLDDSSDKSEIEQFEEMLDTLKGIEKLTQPLSYYGKVYKEKDGLVNNPLLGLCHWTEVQFALDNKYIGKYPGGNWFIFYDTDASLSKNIRSANEYSLFDRKRQAVAILRAKKKKQDEEDKMIDEVTNL